MVSASITVILSSWKRSQYLSEQVIWLRNQTVAPSEIWIWADECKENRMTRYDTLSVDRVFQNSTNLGVYGRFAIGLLARTDYVAIFDDDTFPGRRYLENCLETIGKYQGIIAAAGVQFISASYRPCERYGWAKRTANVMQVDVGCNAWFLQRSWLGYLWLEPPFNWNNGEDMRLSYLAQKYGSLSTYTPAQVEDEMCGSLLPERGHDEAAISSSDDHYRVRSDQLVEQLTNGWHTVRRIHL